MERIGSRIGWSVLLLVAVTPIAARADDSYSVLPIRELELTEGQLPPEPTEEQRRSWWKFVGRVPRAVIEGEGESFVERPVALPTPGAWPSRDWNIAVRTSERREVRGALFWPLVDGGATRVKFRIPASTGSAEKKNDFLQIRLRHYNYQLQSNPSGAAWFRHQAHETRRSLGLPDDAAAAPPRSANTFDFVDQTFDLFSGERALHENLQLDRQLLTTEAAREEIDLASISGITVREMDWTPLVQGKNPAPDFLASFVPDDQHAVFFRSFTAFADTLDALNEPATPMLRILEANAANRELRARYERQLGLALSAAARLLGPNLVQSVAITGGDPYFRSGTDVAVLLQSNDAAALRTAVVAQVAINAGQSPNVETLAGEISGVTYTGRRTADRRVSSYVAQFDKLVVVSNSLAQLTRLVDIAQGRGAPLARLPEYSYFRDRYRLEDERESALLVISDKTIRRWCGPKWRIGASRRTRAAAVLADYQAAYLDQFVAGNAVAGRIPGAAPAATGPLSIAGAGVRSDVFGGAEFLVPISELDFQRATREEARLYEAWRDQYQSYWRNFFDPIAIRISVRPREMAFDMTVVPLINNSAYRTLIDLSRGATLDARSGDPHRGTLFHAVQAINVKSSEFAVSLLRSFCRDENGKGDPRAWLGSSIAIYVEDDPLWQAIAKMTEAERRESMDVSRNTPWPTALRVAVTDQAEFAFALKKMRSLFFTNVEREADWSELTYRGQTYVRSPRLTKAAFPVFYSLAAGNQWLLTPSEPLLKRAIDRQLDGPKPPAATPPAQEASAQGDRIWLGDHMAVEVSGPLPEPFKNGLSSSYSYEMQRLSWNHLPILNEWKRRYPDSDPVALHERFWQARLECPGGGTYRWNEEFQTMESTVFGHPEKPKVVELTIPILLDLRRLGLGVTFENSGLRARGVWQRTKPSSPSNAAR